MLRNVVLLLSMSMMNLFSAGCEHEAKVVFDNGFQSASILENHSAINDPRERWRACGLQNYSIEQERLCFCRPPHGFVQLTIKDNKIIKGLDKENNNLLTPDELQSFQTVDELFEWIEQAKAQNPRVLEVEYDLRYGYPSLIVYDQSEFIADEEITYHLQNLHRVQ